MNTLTLAAVTLMTAAPTLDSTEPQAEPARVDGPRARFAIGSLGMTGSDQGLPSFGLMMQLGAQLNDTWAVYAQLEGTSLLFYNVGSASLMADATFADLITVGAGVGYVTSSRHYINFSGYGVGEPDPTMEGLQIPVRVQLNLGPTTSSALRHRFFIAAEGSAGLVHGNETNGAIYSAGLSLGYALM